VPVKILFALALLGSMGPATGAGFEDRWTHGLQVQSEQIPGTTSMNGMEFHVSRVTGPDVSLLFARIVAEWNAAPGGNAPRLLRQGGWTMVGRIHNGHSQVVQWRTAEAGAELLWSDADLQVAPSAARLPQYLPAACRWNGPVQGRSSGQQFLQTSGFCAARASEVTAELESKLREEGWRTSRTPAGLRAGRSGSALEAIVLPADDRSLRELDAAMVALVETREAGDAFQRIGRRR